jgi:hypothetical protein
MSVAINACTFACDAQFPFVRVSLYSFIQHNRWFSGTVKLIIHPDFPLSATNLKLLTMVYPNLEQHYITEETSFLREARRSPKTFLLQIKEYAKLYVFSLGQQNLLYFSNTALFMKDVAGMLQPQKITFTSEKSLFYLGKESDLFSRFVEESPKHIDLFLTSALTGEDFDRIDNLTISATVVRDNKFAQLSSALQHASCICYNDSVLSSGVGYQKIKQVWLHKNKEVGQALSSPRAIAFPTANRPAALPTRSAAPPVQTEASFSQETVHLPSSSGLVQSHDLFSYLNGKKIALVANSSLLLDHKYGALIDSHDVVIRFNGYPISPEHTGTKTGIHFIFRQAQFNLEQACDYLVVLSNPIDPWKNTIRHIFNTYPTKRIVNFNFPPRNAVSAAFGKVIAPTSGVCAILFIGGLRLTSATISLFGFNGYLGGKGSMFRSNEDQSISSTHNYVAERKYFQTNFKEISPGFLQRKIT